MPQYLYRLTLTHGRAPSDLTPDDQAVVGAHFAHLQELTRQGVMILVGRTQVDDPSTMGIAIFEADSDDAAQQIMAADPAIQGGVMSGELFPFAIALQRGQDL